MNILIAATHITRSNGGVSTHIVDLCRGLLKYGHNVVVTSAGGEYLDEIESLGITHYSFPFIDIQKHPIQMLKVFIELKRIVVDNNIDIVHTHGQSLILFLQIIKKMTGVPFVWTNHIDAIPQPDLFKKLYRLSEFPIISVSIDLRQYIIDNLGINRNKITVINNGITVENYHPLSESEKEQYRNQFGVSDTQIVITLPGRMTYGKGHRYLIEAVSKLNVRYPDKEFIVLFAGNAKGNGDIEYLNGILGLSESMGVKTKYIGFQNLRNVLGISNIMVLPSIYEGFGLVCVEAFLMKVPVIRSDSPGHTDMEDICKVFQKQKPDELVKLLCNIIDNPKDTAEMVEHAYDKACREYTKDSMVNKTIICYKKIVCGDKLIGSQHI